MTLHHSAATQRPGRWLLVSLASTVLLAAGCSSLVSTAPGSAELSSAGAVSGRVHGGNQPVAFATVNLYFAGLSGIGSPATLAATTTTADDGAGSFSFVKLADGVAATGNQFSCPATGTSPSVYVVARGGNTLNNHDASRNTASVFIAPMGLCSSIGPSSFIYMSEAVTAATVAAVHQFMNVTTGDIGSDGILASYDGLANAFNTVSNLVSLSTGQTVATVSHTGTAAGVTITATPEQAKINQIGNILASCINNATAAASACTTLFASAVPPADMSTTSAPAGVTFSAPQDVLQAAYYMFTNPTDTNSTNLTNLYNLSAAAGAPYQPTLTTVPSDWTIGIVYSAAGSCGTSTGGFLGEPADINIDISGNLWVSNGGGVSEIAATGVPMNCINSAGASKGGTIDSSKKIWFGDSANNIVYRYDPDALQTISVTTTTPPFAMAADGNGNVYYSSLPVAPATTSSVWMIANGATATTGVGVIPTLISADVGPVPARLIVDGNNALWASSRSSFVSLISPAASGTLGFLNGFQTTRVTTQSPSYGLAANSAVTSANSIYISIQEGVNSIDQLTGTGTNYSTANGFPTAANTGGLNVPSAIAIDGAQNLWAANDQPNTGSGLSSVTELTSAGINLSPNGTTAGGYQKASSYFVNGRAIAIDQAGNVWIGRDGSNALTEVVGGGVPIFQPFALGLAQGRFQKKP